MTTQLVQAGPLTAGATLTLPLVAGRSCEIPVPATAGETLSTLTSSHDFYDRILVLLVRDGPPVLGSDDYRPVLCRISVGGRGNRHLSELGYVVREREHG